MTHTFKFHSTYKHSYVEGNLSERKRDSERREKLLAYIMIITVGRSADTLFVSVLLREFFSDNPKPPSPTHIYKCKKSSSYSTTAAASQPPAFSLSFGSLSLYQFYFKVENKKIYKEQKRDCE